MANKAFLKERKSQLVTRLELLAIMSDLKPKSDSNNKTILRQKQGLVEAIKDIDALIED